MDVELSHRNINVFCTRSRSKFPRKTYLSEHLNLANHLKELERKWEMNNCVFTRSHSLVDKSEETRSGKQVVAVLTRFCQGILQAYHVHVGHVRIKCSKQTFERVAYRSVK